jgi:hypothetical protein
MRIGRPSRQALISSARKIKDLDKGPIVSTFVDQMLGRSLKNEQPVRFNRWAVRFCFIEQLKLRLD